MAMFKKISLSKPRGVGFPSLNIRSKLLLLSGFLIAMMIGSNYFMRAQVFEGSDVLRSNHHRRQEGRWSTG